MPTIANGGNATIAVTAGQILTVECHGVGEYTYENPVGTRIYDGGGTASYGPFAAAGNVKLTSQVGSIYYEAALLPNKAPLPFDPANVAITGGTIGGNNVTATSRFGDISGAYKFFIPGNQFLGSGSGKDLSGKAANLVFRSAATDAETWATGGYFASAAGVNKGLAIAKATADLSVSATKSLLISVAFKSANPAATPYTMGWGGGGKSGVYFQPDASGPVTVAVVADSLTTYYASSVSVINEAAEHVMTVGFDGPTRSIYIWRDGILCSSNVGLWAGNVTQTPDFCFGNYKSEVGDSTVAVIGRGLHCLAFNGGLPINVGAIAQQLGAYPLLPITAGLVGF